MAEKLRPCPFCGGEARIIAKPYEPKVCVGCDDDTCLGFSGLGWLYDSEQEAAEAWNRRAGRTWHDFSDELPPVGVSVLCRGKNGALYVGKPVTFKGNGTRKVWVPRGDQYRTPEKCMEAEK